VHGFSRRLRRASARPIFRKISLTRRASVFLLSPEVLRPSPDAAANRRRAISPRLSPSTRCRYARRRSRAVRRRHVRIRAACVGSRAFRSARLSITRKAVRLMPRAPATSRWLAPRRYTSLRRLRSRTGRARKVPARHVESPEATKCALLELLKSCSLSTEPPDDRHLPCQDRTNECLLLAKHRDQL